MKFCITLPAIILIVLATVMMYEPRNAAAVSLPATTETIAYVVPDDTTGDQVWLVEPDASHPRKIYSTGEADPYGVKDITSLSWRPDAGELVFSSNHENYCSWYGSDVYAIRADGSGYRRVTNGPACAALANYLKGSVTVSAPMGGSFYQIYVAGAPEPKTPSLGTATFDNVADLGSTSQPVVAIEGGYRWFGDPVDVKAGQNVGWTTSFYGEGSASIGAYAPVWRSDGSRIGYAFGCAALYSIADQPPVNTQGEQLFYVAGVTPCVMAWGPTPGTASDIVYFTGTGDKGIYRTTEYSGKAGDKLVNVEFYLFALQYLPDASGLIFTMADNWGDSSNIYRYDFGSGNVTQLTNYTDQYARDFSLSPDGQRVIFELAPHEWGAPWGGASDLWMMGIDGSNAQLFKTGGSHPSWSLRAPQVPPSTTLPTSKLYLPLLVR